VSTPLDRRSTLLRWLPVLAWMALIFVLSSVSGLRVSEDAGVDRPFRVLGHLSTYAVLAALVLYALGGRRRPRAVHAAIAYAVTLAYGLSDEFHQSFVPNRTGRLDDVVTDAIGAAIGLALGYVGLWMWARWTTGPRTDQAEDC
jgi:VanZ family protein